MVYDTNENARSVLTFPPNVRTLWPCLFDPAPGRPVADPKPWPPPVVTLRKAARDKVHRKGGYGLHKGRHLLIDCRNVPRELCLDDRRFLQAMSTAAEKAGATVVSQVRYKFGSDSPPGFTAIVMLDESHVSAHTYADKGLVAMDVFTCGSTDPGRVWEILKQDLGLGDDHDVRQYERFVTEE